MRDAELVTFLQWALPRLGMRWEGFRKVRRQVGKRIGRRLRELGLDDLAAYGARLKADPAEWPRLDALCRVTISRFYRDRGVWDSLRARALPDLAREAQRRGDGLLRVWSCGCASGEEPYTVALAWHLEIAPVFSDLRPAILATDIDAALLARGRRAVFTASSIKELPAVWRETAFLPLPDRAAAADTPRASKESAAASPSVREGAPASRVLRRELRRGVHFVRHDLRHGSPGENFDFILCRNLAFTYFAENRQRLIASALAASLVPGGLLLLAPREILPAESTNLLDVGRVRGLYRAPA
jgi:chemotaxis protein methyltransferase CheR